MAFQGLEVVFLYLWSWRGVATHLRSRWLLVECMATLSRRMYILEEHSFTLNVLSIGMVVLEDDD